MLTQPNDAHRTTTQGGTSCDHRARNPSHHTGGDTNPGRKDQRRSTRILQTLIAWIVVASLWIADKVIGLMLRTRSNERRIKPTERRAWPKGLKQELMRRQNNTCVYCGNRRTARNFEIDHIVPVVRGGSNDKSNLQVICAPCNQRKGIQTDEEFRARYSKLLPSKRLTAPRKPIPQNDFGAATRRTSQSDAVRQFRKTRFISKREKVGGACLGLAIVIAFVLLLVLSSFGIEGLPALLPPAVVGAAVGIGIFVRAQVTGVLTED